LQACFSVDEAPSKDASWCGPVNRPLQPAVFRRLLDKALAYVQGRELFVFDGWACADPKYRLPVRVIAEKAWHSLFARCLLLRPKSEDVDFTPELTVLHAADLHADPAVDGTRAGAFILLSFSQGQ